MNIFCCPTHFWQLFTVLPLIATLFTWAGGKIMLFILGKELEKL